MAVQRASRVSLEGTRRPFGPCDPWMCAALSSYCRMHLSQFEELCAVWKEMVLLPGSKKLALWYLMNDVLQRSKGKAELRIEGTAQSSLEQAASATRPDTAALPKVKRVLGIWRDRAVVPPLVVARLLSVLAGDAEAAAELSTGASEAPIDTTDSALDIADLMEPTTTGEEGGPRGRGGAWGLGESSSPLLTVLASWQGSTGSSVVESMTDESPAQLAGVSLADAGTDAVEWARGVSAALDATNTAQIERQAAKAVADPVLEQLMSSLIVGAEEASMRVKRTSEGGWESASVEEPSAKKTREEATTHSIRVSSHPPPGARVIDLAVARRQLKRMVSSLEAAKQAQTRLAEELKTAADTLASGAEADDHRLSRAQGALSVATQSLQLVKAEVDRLGSLPAEAPASAAQPSHSAAASYGYAEPPSYTYGGRGGPPPPHAGGASHGYGYGDGGRGGPPPPHAGGASHGYGYGDGGRGGPPPFGHHEDHRRGPAYERRGDGRPARRGRY
jgi:hypothetical protein